MKPIITKRDKNISISVFQNETKDGKKYVSVQLQRSFMKKGSTEWSRETINLFKEDLLALAQLASDTYTDIINEEAKAKGGIVLGRNSYDENDDIPF